MTPGTAQWILSYELSPIIFCNGIASQAPGGVLPIISITEADSFPSGILGAGGPIDVNDYFAHFLPAPGATLGENQIGEYSFANQAVAGNALIAQPLYVSMIMVCPARGADGFAVAKAKMTALVSAMAQHDAMGGTYTVVTPKYDYTNLVRLRMPDASTAQTHQAQNTYQIDFKAPLLTLEQAQQAQSSLMAKLGNGAMIQGQPTWSGTSPTVGQTGSLAGATTPAAQSTQGANTTPQGGGQGG